MTRSNAPAHRKRTKAVQYFREARFEDARRLLVEISRADPGDADIRLLLGATLAQLDRAAEAEACFQKALEIRPAFFEAALNLAHALELQGKLNAAVAAYQRALQLNPNSVQACRVLARVCSRHGPLELAAICLQRAIQLDPGKVDDYVELGKALHGLGLAEQALAALDKALVLDPRSAKAHRGRAAVLSSLWRLDEALECVRQLQRLEPGLVDPIALEVGILYRKGESVAAIERLRPLLSAEGDDVQLALTHAQLCEKMGDCTEAIARLERLVNLPELHVLVRGDVHHALGNLYDKAAAWDQAFAHFKAVNDLQGPNFDCAGHTAFIDRLISTFSRAFLAAAPRATEPTDRPVFIVGMPRSGTSLIEQILASHPAVAGGGELRYVSQLAERLGVSPDNASNRWQDIESITSARCDEVAREYLQAIESISGNAQRVTDKMPQNFLYLGLIALLFPQARIIHCRRDPLDTCLSCYFQNFLEGHTYSRDLGHLGFYYKEYERLMAHWREALNVPMLELDYEDVVADMEGAARRLVAFCGLPWDDQCLRFFESERTAKTASYAQVRQPIYTRSVARWRHYEAHLGTLRRALEGAE